MASLAARLDERSEARFEMGRDGHSAISSGDGDAQPLGSTHGPKPLGSIHGPKPLGSIVLMIFIASTVRFDERAESRFEMGRDVHS